MEALRRSRMELPTQLNMADSMQPIGPKRTSYMSRRNPSVTCSFLEIQDKPATAVHYIRAFKHLQAIDVLHSQKPLSCISLPIKRGMPAWVSTLFALIPQCINPTFHPIYSQAHLQSSVPIHHSPADMLQRRKHLIRSSTEYLNAREQSELGYETSSQRTELTISIA